MARITSKQAQGMMDAYANVYTNKEEPVKEIIEENIQEDVEQLNELGGLGIGGLNRMRSNQGGQSSQGSNPGRTVGAPRLTGAQRAQQMAKDRIAAGKNTVTGQPKAAPQQASSQQSAPQQAAPQQGGLRGGLSKLGNLAGRAVGAVKQGINKVSNAAGNVKAAVTGGIKGGVQGAKDAVADRNRAPGAAKQASVRAAQSDTTSPAAKAGLSPELRARAAEKNAKFQKNRSSSGGRSNVQSKVTSVMDMEDYNPMTDLFDYTVNFLVSEGHVANEEEALTVMAEQEFMESFNEGYQQVINEEA